uniref:Uncharacterized protein n=1 Tax=Arundo donax TaxID=35708 RepID=A0A0A9ART9_ARUDO
MLYYCYIGLNYTDLSNSYPSLFKMSTVEITLFPTT